METAGRKNRILVSVQEGLEKNESNAWVFDLVESGKIEDFEEKVLEKFGYDGEEVSILFCDDEFIREFNKRDRGIDSATDILEYENGEEYEDEEGDWYIAGDMLISFETLPKNAEYFGVGQNEELKRLLVHGTLHLNGYDHGDAHVEPGVEVTDEMLRMQEDALKDFGEIRLI